MPSTIFLGICIISVTALVVPICEADSSSNAITGCDGQLAAMASRMDAMESLVREVVRKDEQIVAQEHDLRVLRTEVEQLRQQVARMESSADHRRRASDNEAVLSSWLRSTVAQLRSELTEVETEVEAKVHPKEAGSQKVKLQEEKQLLDVKEELSTLQARVVMLEDKKASLEEMERSFEVSKRRPHITKKFLAKWVQRSEGQHEHILKEVQMLKMRLDNCDRRRHRSHGSETSDNASHGDKFSAVDGGDLVNHHLTVDTELQFLFNHTDLIVAKVNQLEEAQTKMANRQNEFRRLLDQLTEHVENSDLKRSLELEKMRLNQSSPQ